MFLIRMGIINLVYKSECATCDVTFSFPFEMYIEICLVNLLSLQPSHYAVVLSICDHIFNTP
jgi:hypothetical protein